MIEIKNINTYGWEDAIRKARLVGFEKIHESDSSWIDDQDFVIGKADKIILKNAIANKNVSFLDYIRVSMEISAPVYWWCDAHDYFDGSIMKEKSTKNYILDSILSKPFSIADFAFDNMSLSKTRATDEYIHMVLEPMRESILKANDPTELFNQLLQLLPISYHITDHVCTSYKTLREIYAKYYHVNSSEWKTICHMVHSLPYNEILIQTDLLSGYSFM